MRAENEVSLTCQCSKERHRSGDLIQALARAALVDEYRLAIHPLVLGKGRRLFPENEAMTKLRLVDEKTTTKGVLVATYRPS